MSSVKRQRVNGNHDNLLHDDSLYQAICQRNWEESRALLKRIVAIRLTQFANDLNRNTLHEACYSNAPCDIVEAIHNIRPSLLVQKDNNGWTPLFYSCFYGSDEMLSFLLEVNPLTATMADVDGWLPLHYAVYYSRAPSLIRRLLVAYPGGVYAANRYGDTPLSWFMNEWQQTLVLTSGDRRVYEGLMFRKIFSLLLMAYVHGTVQGVKYGDRWLLLHEAVRHNATIPIPSILVQALLQNTTRNVCAQADHGGSFPLHLACALPSCYVGSDQD